MKKLLIDLMIVITIILLSLYFFFGNLYLIASLCDSYGNGSDAFIHITTRFPLAWLGSVNVLLIPLVTYTLLRGIIFAVKAIIISRGKLGTWVDYI